MPCKPGSGGRLPTYSQGLRQRRGPTGGDESCSFVNHIVSLLRLARLCFRRCSCCSIANIVVDWLLGSLKAAQTASDCVRRAGPPEGEEPAQNFSRSTMESKKHLDASSKHQENPLVNKPIEANEEEEDDDYMSPALLERLIPSSASASAGAKSLPAARTKPVAQTEQEVLAQGLATALDKDNLGYKLFAKLGYKPEDSSAKPPIELVVKTDRMGIGLETELKQSAKRIRDQALEDARKRGAQEDEIRKQYIQAKGQKFESKRVLGQLRKARQILADLNDQLGAFPEAKEAAVKDPSEIQIESLSESDSGEVDSSPVDLPKEDVDPLYWLQNVVDQLRGEPYFWCFWCGSRFENEQDLEDNCPGRFEEDHD